MRQSNLDRGSFFLVIAVMTAAFLFCAIQLYQNAHTEVKKSCRRDKRNWIESKGKEADAAASRSDAKTLYGIIRELGGTRSSSNIKDKNGNTLQTVEDHSGMLDWTLPVSLKSAYAHHYIRLWARTDTITIGCRLGRNHSNWNGRRSETP